MDVSKLTLAYINIRDKRSELKKAFDDEYNDLGEKLKLLEAQLLRVLQENHANTLSTDFGTIYRQEDLKPSCSDWNALYKWIGQHDAYDVLEKRVKKDFIKNYMEINEGKLPPGVSVYREYVARVRRS